MNMFSLHGKVRPWLVVPVVVLVVSFIGAGALVEGALAEDEESETLAMLQHLDRKGEGSKYTFTNDEGETVKARRRKGQWEMEVVKSGEKNTVISMPWGMAECMLGRDVPAYSGKDDLEFKIEQDGGVSIRIE